MSPKTKYIYSLEEAREIIRSHDQIKDGEIVIEGTINNSLTINPLAGVPIPCVQNNYEEKNPSTNIKYG